MEDFTCDADNPDNPDVWMWSFFEDDDASKDATATKARQMGFFLAFT